ncbi:hypothetical protein DL93DRAFT_1863634 [Clavulina sp. PMI_390]|nr:hypothetical protein DL93DRAFT_1863634 [Clavulina sp. PMI_390]
MAGLDLTGVSVMLAALPGSVSQLRVCSISSPEVVGVPLMIVKGLLSQPSGRLLVPYLRHLECSVGVSSTHISPKDVQTLFITPYQSQFEVALIEMLKERKLVRVQLPVVSTACIQLAAQHGVEVVGDSPG